MQAALTAILAMIQQFLPLIGTGAAAVSSVGSIITALEKWLPIIVAEGEALYTPVKNIIAALQNSGAVTSDQVAQLQQLDAKMDTAFEAATVGLDPDVTAT